MSALLINMTAIEDALELGLADHDTVFEKLTALVNKAAMCTDDLGNRRYRDLIFDVIKTEDGDELQHVSLRNLTSACTICFGTKEVSQFEPCEICEGDGCESCNNEGGASESIPCPDCSRR